MDNLFTDSIERLFAQIASPEVIRAIDGGGSADALWRSLEESGFLDVLVPEESGGAGLTLTDAFPLFLLAGRYAIPAPFVQTALARAWLHAVGVNAPRGSITVAGFGLCGQADALQSTAMPFGRVADWVLAQVDQEPVLLPVAEAEFELASSHGSLEACLRWVRRPSHVIAIPSDSLPGVGLAGLAAASYAPLLAGAAHRVLELTLGYANQRTQFGKNIGRFQAIQSQVSVMAERVWAARMAAQLACQSSNWEPNYLRAAVGKSRCSEAAMPIADIGHAVHGAIGITEEYDLQLYTRRLREWRMAAGTETYWARQIGTRLLRQSEHTALSFICEALSP